jgi:Mce-associated membrane protein
VSPRRRMDTAVAPDEAVGPDYFAVTPRGPRRWGLALACALATVVVLAAIAGSVVMLVQRQDDRRVALKDAAALGYTREFMTMYTSLDPFHANDYADRIAAQATGVFAQSFKEKQNEILVQVARAEPTTGQVLEAGVQRWNDDGSADVLVAVKATWKTPDGKTTFDSGSRWIATTIKEGQQWKISNLVQVI